MDWLRRKALRQKRARREAESAEPEPKEERPELAPFARPELAPFASGEIACPACAETIKAAAKVCKHCGHEIGSKVGKKARDSRRVAMASAPQIVQTKSPGVAAVLAFFIPGLGHVYAGRITFGLCYMVAVPVGAYLAFAASAAAALSTVRGPSDQGGALASIAGAWGIILLAVCCCHIWQIYDAYSSCAPAPTMPALARRRR